MTVKSNPFAMSIQIIWRKLVFKYRKMHLEIWMQTRYMHFLLFPPVLRDLLKDFIDCFATFI